MNTFKPLLSLLTVLIGITLVTILNPGDSQAAPTDSTIHVATTGADTPSCGTAASPCRTIKYAVNSASSGDTILVAGGTYTTLGNCVVGTAVICVFAKELTILGGYTTSNWSAADPAANPTIIDGQNSNRPILLDGRTLSYTPVIRVEGFTVQNGYVQGASSGSDSVKSAFGGGLLAETGQFILRDLVFQNNTAQGGNSGDPVGGSGSGGGMAIKRAVNGTLLEDITFQNNSAYGGSGSQRGGYAIGGGLFTYQSTTSGSNLTFNNNVTRAGSTNGSGTYNGEKADAQGAGIALQIDSNITFNNVVITSNIATGGNAPNGNAGGAFGAGLFTEMAALSISNLTVQDNAATGGTGQNNALDASLASGGGVALSHSDIVIEQANIVNNTAQGGDGNIYAGAGGGGGIYIERFSGSASTTLTNVIVADNLANMGSGNPLAGGGGGGLFLNSSTATLEHVTFARNRLGNTSMQGNAIVLIGGSQAAVSRSIIADHTDYSGAIAIHAQSGNTVNFSNNLLSGNNTDTGGGGTFTGTGSNFGGSPDFASPGAPNYDYHIKSNSTAIDQAGGSTTAVDIDNQYRPDFSPPDVGADEFAPVTLTVAPGDSQLYLTWSVNTALLSGLNHYQILITPSSGASNPDQGVSVNAGLQTGYTLTGLTNYKEYTVIVEARTNANTAIASSNSVTIFPTDQQLFLPAILK